MGNQAAPDTRDFPRKHWQWPSNRRATYLPTIIDIACHRGTLKDYLLVSNSRLKIDSSGRQLKNLYTNLSQLCRLASTAKVFIKKKNNCTSNTKLREKKNLDWIYCDFSISVFQSVCMHLLEKYYRVGERNRIKKKFLQLEKNNLLIVRRAFVSRDLSRFSRDRIGCASFDGTSEFGPRFQQTDDPIDEIYEPCCRSRRAVSSPLSSVAEQKGSSVFYG